MKLSDTVRLRMRYLLAFVCHVGICLFSATWRILNKHHPLLVECKILLHLPLESITTNSKEKLIFFFFGGSFDFQERLAFFRVLAAADSCNRLLHCEHGLGWLFFQALFNFCHSKTHHAEQTGRFNELKQVVSMV